MTGAATGGNITCTASGSDSIVGFTFSTKGTTGDYRIYGQGNSYLVEVYTTASSGNVYGMFIQHTASSPDNNTSMFINCADSTAQRAVCYSDGDWYNHDNTYSVISDPSLKTDIIPATNQWNDVKKLSKIMVKYKSKLSKDKNKVLLGWNAEDVYNLSPALAPTINWNDQPLKGVNSSVILLKGFKALGEVMERVEKLEEDIQNLKEAA